MLRDLYIAKLNNEEYPMIYNFNTMIMAQKEYGTLNKFAKLIIPKKVGDEIDEDQEVDREVLRYAMYIMLNEGIKIYNKENGANKEKMELEEVGDLILASDVNVAWVTVLQCMMNFTTTEKNAETTQKKKK